MLTASERTCALAVTLRRGISQVAAGLCKLQAASVHIRKSRGRGRVGPRLPVQTRTLPQDFQIVTCKRFRLSPIADASFRLLLLLSPLTIRQPQFPVDHSVPWLMARQSWLNGHRSDAFSSYNDCFRSSTAQDEDLATRLMVTLVRTAQPRS